MIDLVSTREAADPQAAACANLLATVIAQAIKDASIGLWEKEQKAQMNLNENARSALDFLWWPKSAFAVYADLIGLDAESIRTACLRPTSSVVLRKMAFSDMQRRTLAIRHAFYQRERDVIGWDCALPGDEGDEGDEDDENCLSVARVVVTPQSGWAKNTKRRRKKTNPFAGLMR